MNTRVRKGKAPPKGVYPPQLLGKGFDARPENINKYGVPSDAITLRKMIQAMGNEEVEVILKKGAAKIKMTRFERILFEWFTTQNSRKQELLMAYGFGKPAETINVSGELKIIKVGLKKKDDTG